MADIRTKMLLIAAAGMIGGVAVTAAALIIDDPVPSTREVTLDPARGQVLAAYEQAWDQWVAQVHDPVAAPTGRSVFTGKAKDRLDQVVAALRDRSQRITGTYIPNGRITDITSTEATVVDCGTETFTHVDAVTGDPIEATGNKTVGYQATLVHEAGDWVLSALVFDPDACAVTK